jgi:hypothetical protein
VETDIKLLQTAARIEAPDLELDAGSERRSNDQGRRRALVHDFHDGLTINWAGDYPGGVSLFGVRQIIAQQGGLTLGGKGGKHLDVHVGDEGFTLSCPSSIEIHKIDPQTGKPTSGIAIDPSGEMKIWSNGKISIDAPDGTHVGGGLMVATPGDPPMNVSVGVSLTDLWAAIDELKKRVTALENA